VQKRVQAIASTESQRKENENKLFPFSVFTFIQLITFAHIMKLEIQQCTKLPVSLK